jgi:Mg-chelatase subunit ChlD
MTDPVICSDGHSYERAAIMCWLNEHNRSNIVITNNIVPNHSLRNSIEEYMNTYEINIINTSHISVTNVSCSTAISNSNTVQVSCEDIQVKNPVDFVFAIDNSASMGDSAGIQGDVETMCYSRLDLVKHATLCIIESLDENDTLGIVVYSSNARVLVQRINMNQANKTIAINYIKNICLEGSTNLWDGLQTSINMAEASPHASPCVLLFTDGQPTAGNQQVERALSNYISQKKSIKSQIYTFGFSNDVNSNLLNEISRIGKGQFHFISDSAMIFTIIVNFLSNYFTKYGDIYINNTYSGPLYYGQTKHIMYDGTVNTVTVHDVYGSSQQTSIHYTNTDDKLGIAIADTINIIENVMISLNRRNFTNAKTLLDNHIASLSNDNNSKILNDLVENISDQIYLASSIDYCNKWGKHYMYSFCNALKNQINNNFKDNFVQNFGGTKFYELQDKLNNIVANITPPPPSNTYNGRSYSVQSMSTFNSRSNPCFAGFNKVKMENNCFKYVKDIQKGDYVWTPYGSAKVVLVVKTICADNLTELSKVGSLVVTPWHPIKYENTWRFPYDLSQSKLKQCEAVYSFVLDKHHIMNIENFDVICLAHGYTDGILAHEFWGTRKIISNLKTKDGYDEGLVVLKSGCLMNHPITGLVCSL